MTEQISGITGFDDASVILYLASVYSSSAAALGEVPDNGLDAGATQIWVELWPDDVIVTDNGHGMVPELLPEDENLLEFYQEEARAGKLRPGEDIRLLISETSGSSLAWMMRHVAWSPKSPKPGVRGTKGIGSLSWRQFAMSAVWLTRPSKELAQNYWRNDPRASNVPTLRLVPPSREQLDVKNTTFTIDEVPTAIVDPDGNVLVSGTKVTMSRIIPGSEFSLRPGLLAEHFQVRFGPTINAGRLTLTIIDHTTEEGKATPGGRRINILPVQYGGMLILDEERRLPGGKHPFKVEIYYNPDGGKGVQLRRQGNDVAPLKTLPQLNHTPFDHHRLEGFVEFPSDLSEQEAPWNPNKTMPLPSRHGEQWERVVKDLARPISDTIREIEETERADAVQRYAREVAVATATAMESLSEFKGLHLRVPTSRTKKQSTSERKPPPTSVDITVLDENNRGVPKVAIELFKGGKLVDVTATGSYGNATFGEQPVGRYTVQMDVPSKSKPQSDTSVVINLTEDRPGYRIVFKLRTGQPAPEKKKLPGFQLWFRAIGDSSELYDASRLDLGIFEINTISPDMREALHANRWAVVDELVAMYVALGVTEFCLRGEPHYLYLHTQAARLYGRLLLQLRERPQANVRVRRSRKK